MKTSNEILQIINQYLDNMPFERRPKSLYDPIRYVLSMGGKRIRPVLMMMSYNLFKDDPERIIRTAAALETYHNYTLLHDDLMDNADMRRGNPTVHKQWDANTAILSGDAMLVLAYEMMADCPEENLRDILNLFTETALEITEGQQYDMEFESRDDVSEHEYIEMIRLKTSVLLACAMKMGALLAGASTEDAERLYRFGERIGLAFQLQDDYLDVYGDPATFGKAIGGDIICNKKTYMLINAEARASASQRNELRCWLRENSVVPSEKIAAVTRIYNDIGVGELAEKKIKEYFDEGRKYLDEVSVDESRKAELRAYTDKMMHREK